MAEKTEAGDIPEHPIIRQIREQGAGRTPVSMEGYVGKAGSDDSLRLYPSLENLTTYYEIPISAVITADDQQHGGPCKLWVDAGADVKIVSVNAVVAQVEMIDGSILAANLANTQVMAWITFTRTIVTISKLRVCTGGFCRVVGGGAGVYSAFRCQTDVVECPSVDCPTGECASARCPPTHPALCTRERCTDLNCRPQDLSVTCRPSDPLLCSPRCPEWCAAHNHTPTQAGKK